MKRRFAALVTGLFIVLFSLAVAAEGEGTAPDKVVYHLDDAANARWALMLAGGHMEAAADARIVVVAYGPGVDFLLKGAQDFRGNAYAPAVESLMTSGVDFRVCANTLAARAITEADVLDDVRVVPSGTMEIVRLQNREGFAYLKP